jgi:hypothetical protein
VIAAAGAADDDTGNVSINSHGKGAVNENAKGKEPAEVVGCI